MYLDANFFIFAYNDGGKKGKKAREILEEITTTKRAITSALALDEVMWVLKRNNQSSEMQELVQQIYSINNLEVKEVPARIPLLALHFIEIDNLKPRDAFHAAIMEHNGITEIISDDSDFDKITWVKRIGF